MKIPLISRFRSKNWPAEIWIVKAFKNKPEIEKTRGRRVDEKEDRNDITAQETRFELKGGGTTAPVPYSEIYQTNESPLVILLSPERGTYIPAEITLHDGDKDKESVEAALDVALENQEWLRWGKQMVTDMRLSWEEDKGWWEKHGEKLVLVLTAVAVVTGAIMNYMGMNNLGQAVKKIAEQASQSIIPIMAWSFKDNLRNR